MAVYYSLHSFGILSNAYNQVFSSVMHLESGFLYGRHQPIYIVLLSAGLGLIRHS